MEGSSRSSSRKGKSSKPKKYKFHYEKELSLVRDGKARLTALDCEMIGVYNSPNRCTQVPIYTSIYGQDRPLGNPFVLMDQVVLQIDNTLKVRHSPYTEHFTGINEENLPEILKHGIPYDQLKSQVISTLRGSVLLTHGRSDLSVFGLNASTLAENNIRHIDTCNVFRKGLNAVSLKRLARHFMGCEIQQGAHSSTEDAKVTYELFMNLCVEGNTLEPYCEDIPDLTKEERKFQKLPMVFYRNKLGTLISQLPK